MSELEARIAAWRDRMVLPGAAAFAAWRAAFAPWFAEGEQIRSAWQDAPAEQSWSLRLIQAEGLLLGVRAYAQDFFHLLSPPDPRPVRIEDLIDAAQAVFADLGFDPDQIAMDAPLPLGQKSGVDLFQGILLSGLLEDPVLAARLMRDMRRPKSVSEDLLADFQRSDRLDLGAVLLERNGPTGLITFTIPDSLNSEDDALLEAFETAVDLVLLHPEIRTGVLRGGVMTHPKYRDRRVFCSGINLTKLLKGQISYLYFITREFGVLNKIYRGMAMGPSDDLGGVAYEKPWIGVVDGHAIGGGVQMLLILDHVIAEQDAFLAVPARTEGFIPGLANLRLPRLVGARQAHQIVELGLRVVPTDPLGQSLVDVAVPTEQVEAALSAAIDRYQDSGAAGVIANRRAFRLAEEPEELFRAYMAQFCLEQARCLYDPSSAAHLNRVWTQRTKGL
ncbi:MAG: enoyl-CoA hydratase/isomerase family protein [Rhodospirillaceae bacterium]